MDNSQIARLLREIGELLQMNNELIFKYRAYEKAADAIETLSEHVAEIYKKGGLAALENISGVGVSIAEKIEELLKTGHLKYYEKLKNKFPIDFSQLGLVEGLGPRHLKSLYQKLKITNLEELEKAALEGKIRELAGFGPTSEEKLLRSIAFIKKSGGRFLLGELTPLVRDIEKRLAKLPAADQVVVAGSVRRRKETIGDIDILMISEKPQPIMDFFVAMPEVHHVVAHGETKSVVRLKNSVEIDLRVVPKESYGAALNYFTGSKEHNVALRQRAIERGYKLNEYGLFSAKGGSASGGKSWKRIAGKTEEDLYRVLGFAYIEPELREMTGELAAAEKGELPQLINYDDLKGDLQVQTDWTDGSASIKEMAMAALTAGLEYIVITDHTKRLAMTGGLDSIKLRRQMKEIDILNEKLKRKNQKFRILKGSECDILKDGSLDLPDEVLAELDVVGASIHSHFNLSRSEQTKRLQKAMANPHVDIIFHPTGRILNKRPAYELDMEAIIALARKTGTVLEIDAFPDRLDLCDQYIKLCVVAGVKMAIDSDAHSISHFSVLEYGIAQARRGWATKQDIINAWPVEKMLSFLK